MSLGCDDDEREKEADYGPFEGVEKKLVIDFTGKGSLREIERSRFDVIFSNAVCTALSCTSNDELDAFVLSESSCFVYDHRIILKTCGTTEPIGAVPAILAEAHKQGLSAASTIYCHMDFLFPSAQSPAYRSFHAERDLLAKHFTDKGTTSLTLNAGDNPAWNVYTNGAPTHECLELLMYDLSREKMQFFFQQRPKHSISRSSDGLLDVERSKMRKKSFESRPNPAQDLDKRIGITKLAADGAPWDSFLFDPCGYSSNAILGGTYWTIHVTPEEESSYVSFEVSPRPDDVESTIREVLEFFEPQRFSIVLTGNDECAGPAKIDRFVSEGSVCEGEAGYSTWVGHFATPEHIAARPPKPVPGVTAAVAAPTSLAGCDVKAPPALAMDILQKPKLAVEPDTDRSGTDYDDEWDAHSSTEEDECRARYEPGTRASFDEALSKRSGGMGRAMKVVG